MIQASGRRTANWNQPFKLKANARSSGSWSLRLEHERKLCIQLVACGHASLLEPIVLNLECGMFREVISQAERRPVASTDNRTIRGIAVDRLVIACVDVLVTKIGAVSSEAPGK